jgi:hypothetical protein
MKITEVVKEPVPPPKTVILELTEEEAGLIEWFSRYYATAVHTLLEVPAAKRLADKLTKYKSAPVYPYNNAFKDEWKPDNDR